MARSKYPTRNKMIKALVASAKIRIKERDDYTCQYCKKKVSGVSCQASHVIPMSAIGQTRLAFDDNNIKVLCAYHHKQWWHSNPIAATEWFRSTFPDRYSYLMSAVLDRKRIQLSIAEIKELYDKLKPPK